MKNKRKIWVAVCGLMREPDNLLELLKAFNKNKNIEKVVISTWHDEIDSHCGLRKKLINLGAILIEQPQPTIKTKGNIYHQIRSLENGLNKIPDTAFVLKTRADVKIGKDLLEFLQEHLDIANNNLGNFPEIFTHKIWVNNASFYYPFSMQDVVFFGHKLDLAKLINYDSVYDVVFNIEHQKTEIRWFSSPFIYKFPILYSWFKIASFSGYGCGFARSVQEYCLSSPVFIKILASYHCVINRYFKIGFPGRNKNLYDLSFSSLFSDDLPYAPGIHQKLRDEVLLEKVVNGKMKNGSLYEKYMEAMKEVSSYKFHSSFKEDEEFQEFVRALQEFYVVYSPKELILNKHMTFLPPDEFNYIYTGKRLEKRNGKVRLIDKKRDSFVC